MGNRALATNNVMHEVRSSGCQIPTTCGSLLGAAAQGTLGIRMGMIASPLLALSGRGFIPGAGIIAVTSLTVGVVVRGRGTDVGPAFPSWGASRAWRGHRQGRRGRVGAVGPPMALVYRHADLRVARFTLSAFFTVDSLMRSLN